MKSRKNKGGNINKHNAFKYILSIGYEVETDFLAKLTSGYNEEGEQILFNTDSNTQNIQKKESQEGGQDEELEEDEEDGEGDYNDRLRKEEVMHIDAYDQDGKLDNNISFLVTNDMASTALSKKLNKLCCPIHLHNPSSYCGDKVTADLKNKLYKFYTENDFETKTDKEYNIEFVYFDDNECGTFSDVEWVVTYYKPQQSENIILDTFKNLIQNLTRHLDELEQIEGNLVINKIDIRDDSGKIIKTYPERIIQNSLNRILFKSSKENLYYLQTNNSKNKLDVDSICPTFQMTFATNIQHIFQVLKQLIYNKVISFECSVEHDKQKMDILQRVEYCVDQLIDGYNKKERNPKLKISKTESNKMVIKQFKGYLGLILYKLYIYYNTYLEKESQNKDKSKENQKIIYFKDSLFFNPRHSNYDFYLEAKKCLSELFGSGFGSGSGSDTNKIKQNNMISTMIRKIILQPDILNQLLLDDTSKVDENAFLPSINKINKGDEKYGDPYYSLDSYFRFFEEPVDNDSNLYQDDTIIFYDWFQYKGIDKVSTQMDINNNVILVEARNFQKLLSSYIFGDASPELKNEIMNNTTCNKLEKICTLGINFGDLKRFFKLNGLVEKGGKKNRKTLKIRKTRKTRKIRIRKTQKN
jgi:hypothetical protein